MAIEQDAIGARRVRAGSRRGCRRAVANASGGGPRPSMTTSHRTSSGNAPARPIAWPPPNECAITPTGAPDDVAHEQREVDVQQRPREARVERPAVAVTAEVERDRVIAERRDAWREVVEHAAVVVGAVEEQHRRCRRVAPAPEPQRRPIDARRARPDRARGGRARSRPSRREASVAAGSWSIDLAGSVAAYCVGGHEGAGVRRQPRGDAISACVCVCVCVDSATESVARSAQRSSSRHLCRLSHLIRWVGRQCAGPRAGPRVLAGPLLRSSDGVADLRSRGRLAREGEWDCSTIGLRRVSR